MENSINMQSWQKLHASLYNAQPATVAIPDSMPIASTPHTVLPELSKGDTAGISYNSIMKIFLVIICAGILIYGTYQLYIYVESQKQKKISG